MATFANPIFCALDTTDVDQAVAWATQVKDHVGGVKVGLEFFYAHVRAGYQAIAEIGAPVFLDLKLHDIPNTVAGGLRALMTLDPLPVLINVHVAGGPDMMRAAAEAVDGWTKLIGVTIMTSLSNANIADVGYDKGKDTLGHAISMSKLAQSCGLDGIVCSALDIEAIKTATSAEFLTIIPGIRPAGAETGDQKRMATPGSATKAGGDVLVVGRPITQSPDPAAAARAISAEVESSRD